MRILSGLLVLCAALQALPAIVAADEIFESCELQSRVDDNSEGRFIFKVVGNHFANNAVIVAPRCYYNGSSVGSPVNVTLHTADGLQKIERARLKTTGNCAGNPECFYATSYLTRKNGKFYKRQYGSIIVKITPQKDVTGLRCNYCSYYVIGNPGKRAAFRAPVVVPIDR